MLLDGLSQGHSPHLNIIYRLQFKPVVSDPCLSSALWASKLFVVRKDHVASLKDGFCPYDDNTVRLFGPFLSSICIILFFKSFAAEKTADFAENLRSFSSFFISSVLEFQF